MDVFELHERADDIAKKHGADRIVPPDLDVKSFARFVAKMAYGYAVERYGLEAFERTFVLPAILGTSDDIGRWVGCSDIREFGVRNCNVSLGFRILCASRETEDVSAVQWCGIHRHCGPD